METAPEEATVAVVMMTAPDTDVAERLAADLLEERLIACANLVAGVTSVFRWQGEIERAVEVLVLMKTTRAGVGALRARIEELHPYDVPEVLALDVTEGSAPYLAWVREEVAG